MNTRDELKEMIVSHAASWKNEEGKDDMADIYVDDFLNELLSKFKLLPIQNVVGSALPCMHPADKLTGWHDESVLCLSCNCIVSQNGENIEPPTPL